MSLQIDRRGSCQEADETANQTERDLNLCKAALHVEILYSWRKAWLLQGLVCCRQIHVGAGDCNVNPIEFQAYFREHSLYSEQVERWRQAPKDVYEKPVLTLKEQKDLDKLRAHDQEEIASCKIDFTQRTVTLSASTAQARCNGNTMRDRL